jgi:hypothetical protein
VNDPQKTPLGRSSSVLAVITHYRYERARVLAGQPADLSPFLVGTSARLTHVMGPRLRWQDA